MSPCVLHVVDMNPNKRGPVELQLLEMAKHADRTGWRLVVAFPQDAPEWYAKLMGQAGAELLTVPDFTQLPDLIKPDLVHLHFVSARDMRPVYAGRVPTVRTEHNLLPPVGLPRRVVRHLTARWIDRHIAVSHAVGRQLRRDYLIEPRVIHNGVDLTRFRPRADKAALRAELLGLPESAVVITIAAHLVALKQIHLLIEACRQLDAELVIAGAGPERQRLEQLIGSRARILSGDNDVAALYAASDIGVLCSAMEGLGSSAIEAMASGLPLVVTPAPGLNEVPEDGVSGVITKAHTAEALTEALRPLVRDRELRQRMGAAARERAEKHFDVTRAAAETFAVYQEISARPL
jgi:glycosyltransferase involved in cell wall biosynthesis